MKRFLLLDICWVALVILAGWTWSLHDQSEYADRLDHYGLSESAQVVHPSRHLTVQEAAAALAKAKLGPVQVQFHAADHQIFLFATQADAGLPLQSGQWFSVADLTATLPVAVVGQAVVAQLYTGSQQQYLQWDKTYLPVLGTVATRRDSPLNRAIFLNASSTAAQDVSLTATTIYVDGQHLAKEMATIRRVFGGTLTAYHYEGSSARTWWAEVGLTLLRSTGLLLAALGLTWAAARLVRAGTPRDLTPEWRRQYDRGRWRQAVTHVAGAVGLGGAVCWWWFYLTDRTRLIAFVAALWAVHALGLWWWLRRSRLTKEVARHD
ncbi:hypothetical protein [Lacticaseibacillus absianus]|uniref:hypothetical protein n=1 Tax=Lacticaseibacillus absianus TaxID=2729623 RepID=UPI0015C74C6F|nr:hypothetical protein [Lacticaseibacillus absianus]